MARVAFSKVRFLKINRTRRTREILKTFSELGLRQDVVDSLNAMNISQPTWAQCKGIPRVLEKRNVFCSAEAGTGKTLAYLAPLVNLLKEEEERKGVVGRLCCPRAVVLVPSRELAYQILTVAKTMAHVCKFRVVSLCGGIKRKQIKEYLKRPVDLAIATPSSLLLSKLKFGLSLSDVSHLVLDEVDTLLDQSFHKETATIVKSLNLFKSPELPQSSSSPGCQVTMVCATWSAEVEQSVKKLVPQVDSLTSGPAHRGPSRVDQLFIKVPYHLKSDKLLELLLGKKGSSCMVFCNSIPSCDWAYLFLKEQGLPCLRFHGQRTPQERRSTVEEFRSSPAHILVCTDAASQGLDLPWVDVVVNLDFPRSRHGYLHRAGRAGRVGSHRPGTVISLMAHRADVAMAVQLRGSMVP